MTGCGFLPSKTPSAPSAKAAAMVLPSRMPPAAMTGISTFEQQAAEAPWSKHRVDFETATFSAFDNQAINARLNGP